ncbi:ER membrane protein SH3 [Radiomyces spectabilis]|uniref:ER membrane protein SH3 n=1 Tax=Radiomyces spectabilis TaxID=64574 RepID=UPI002220E1FB|nr:ER membrane protein SH3 [Radiomyces spectabilis]KAI8367686.1 ER membrane protein SH3 [Radiomyces spectabilis]
MAEHMQAVKVTLILCSCFFAYGSYWSDWAFDYYLLWANPAEHPNAVSRATLYYATQSEVPNILKYIPFANLMIAAIGFSAGLANMTDSNILFDGASLVLMLFGLSTYATSVKPALAIVSSSTDVKEVTKQLKNIAAAHFIIVLAITGIIGLQVAHYFVMKKSSKNEREASPAPTSKSNNKAATNSKKSQ